VEPQHRRDHLQLNPRMLGFARSTGYAILCIPKGKYNRWTRRHIPGAPRIMKLTGNTSAAALCGEKGHIFINSRTGKRLIPQHFEKMIDKWAAEHPEPAVHQAQRQGIPSDHVNGTKMRQERGTMICSGGDPEVSAKAAGHSKETKAKYL
jgi:hypothetical protein